MQKPYRAKVSLPVLTRDPSCLVHPPLVPTASHFRQITLSSLNGRFFDPVHKHMLVPQWRYSEDYEKMRQDGSVVWNSEEVALSLSHLLEKVNARCGLGYMKAYTETGREIRNFGDLPDFLSKLILGTVEDLPPERVSKPDGRPDPTRAFLSAMKLPKLNIHKAAFFARGSHPTARVILTKVRPPPLREKPKVSTRMARGLLKRVASEEDITLTGEAVRSALSDRGGTVAIAEEQGEETPDLSQTLTTLFSAKELEGLQREYLHLRHFSIAEKVNDAVKSSSRLPGNIQEYLSDVKSKALEKSKFRAIFAMYMQQVVPVLRGKPVNVFRAILHGIGSDTQSLSWSQWLLLNSLLVYSNAPQSLQVPFVCRLLCSQGSYMDILVLLTSLFQGEGQNRQFQALFAQLKSLLETQRLDFASLQQRCEAGEFNYRLVLETLQRK